MVASVVVVASAGAVDCCSAGAAGESAACAKSWSGESAKSAATKSASTERAGRVELVRRDENFIVASAGCVRFCARLACTGLNGRAEISCVGAKTVGGKIGKPGGTHPIPCFLEVLILGGLERNFSEVLILEELKSFRMNVLRGLLEVLIPGKLQTRFSEVLILEGLEAKKQILCSAFMHNFSINYTYVSI